MYLASLKSISALVQPGVLVLSIRSFLLIMLFKCLVLYLFFIVDRSITKEQVLTTPNAYLDLPTIPFYSVSFCHKAKTIFELLKLSAFTFKIIISARRSG